MTSELMRATVAKPQGDAREGGAERSGRQTCDHRNTNRLRGRLWAASVLANAKPNPHQDTASRAGWPAGRVQDLTRGDLRGASRGGVSSGHSSVESRRKTEGAKGQRSQQQRSTAHCAPGLNPPGRQQTTALRLALREPVPPTRCSRGKRAGERNSRRHA